MIKHCPNCMNDLIQIGDNNYACMECDSTFTIFEEESYL